MTLAVAEHMEQRLARTARTIERGPDGRLRKGFSPPSDEIKLWRETVERDDGDDVEVTMIRVPVSSTGKDRDGDRFSEAGLEHMAEQYRAGDVPMFPNHGLDPETGFPEYRFEHQMGGWKDAEIEEEGDVQVCYAIGALSPDNEAADVLERQIENGVVPVSFSVGFMPHNSDTITNEDGEPVGREFHEHDLFETSPVGVPSNPDATIAATARAAAKGAAAVEGIDDPDVIQRLARDLESELKTGGSIDRAFDSQMHKQSDGELQTVEEAIGAYLTETDGSEDDPVSEFLSWAESSKDDDELETIMDVVEAWLETVEGDVDSEPVGSLLSWVEDQQGSDEDDEGDEEDEEETDGDGEDDDEDDEEMEAASVEDVRSLLQEELEPIRTLLEDLVEIAETDGGDHDEDDEEEAAQGDLEALQEDLDTVRSERDDLQERVDELERRLDQTDVQDPKGGRTITQAEREGEDSTEQNSIETTKISDDPEDPDLTRLAEQLKGN